MAQLSIHQYCQYIKYAVQMTRTNKFNGSPIHTVTTSNVSIQCPNTKEQSHVIHCGYRTIIIIAGKDCGYIINSMTRLFCEYDCEYRMLGQVSMTVIIIIINIVLICACISIFTNQLKAPQGGKFLKPAANGRT